MRHSRIQGSNARKFGYGGLLLTLLLAAAIPAISADDKPSETIDAQAMGTSTQKGQHQGLVKALQDMKPVGRIAITGTLGYDLAYIALIPSPTGRRIRFATNRLIRFGEAYANSQSQSFDLTAGEFDLNDSDNKKSGGVLYPAAQLIINKQGQLQFELRQNPWKLVNIIDWNGAGKEKPPA
jgi:hypothetical protein